MNLKWRQLLGIFVDALALCIAFYFGRWIGFAIAAFILASIWGQQMLQAVETTRNVLLSRLPDRCAMCSREILDGDGVTDFDIEGEVKMFHEACADKMEELKQKEKLRSEY